MWECGATCWICFGISNSSVPSLQSYLDKLQEDIGKTLEKVGSREKYINNQLGHLIQEYRSAQAKLSEVTAARQSAAPVCFLLCALTGALCQAKERHQQASGGVMDRTRVLAEVSEQRDHKVTCEMTGACRSLLYDL